MGFPFSSDFERSFSYWFYSPLTFKATLLALLGLISILIGNNFAFLFMKPDVRFADYKIYEKINFNHYLMLIGFLLLNLGIFSWFIIVTSLGGSEVLIGSYHNYRYSINGFPIISFTYFSISLGLPLLASASVSNWQKVGFILFALWALAAVPLGLRGEVLFPLTTTIVILVRKGLRISLLKAMFALVVLLALITGIRQLRMVGIGQISSSNIDLNPLDSIVELGGTLRPVTEVLIWQVTGDDYIYGASYWAPIERGIQRLFLLSERASDISDDRLMNVLVQKRVGPIGFSPIAEAYRNFGTIGVAVVMFLIGLLLGWMELWPIVQFRNALLAAIYIPLLIHVRNAFTSVPAQWFVGIGIIYLIYYIAILAGKKRPNRRINFYSKKLLSQYKL